MPHFHFHLLERSRRLTDSEGGDFPDLAAARAHAVREVRAMLGHEVREIGKLLLDRTIEIAAADQRVIDRIAFTDMVMIRRDPDMM